MIFGWLKSHRAGATGGGSGLPGGKSKKGKGTGTRKGSHKKPAAAAAKKKGAAATATGGRQQHQQQQKKKALEEAAPKGPLLATIGARKLVVRVV